MEAPADPFRPPDQGQPALDTWLTWRAMGTRLRIGRRLVEVETHHWTGLEIVRVDGTQQLRARNLGWHSEHRFEVGAASVRLSSRWYPFRPVQVFVDERLVVEDLFPQRRPLVVGVLALATLFASVLAWSIAYDVVRIVQAWTQAPR